MTQSSHVFRRMIVGYHGAVCDRDNHIHFLHQVIVVPQSPLAAVFLPSRSESHLATEILKAVIMQYSPNYNVDQHQRVWPASYHGRPNPVQPPPPLGPRLQAPDLWTFASVTNIALHPRCFSELHGERESLLNALNWTDDRALGLFRQLAAAGGRIGCSEGHARREARKKHSWCKKQIEETINEEKNILMRLNEVCIEIQSRERWCIVRRENEITGDGGYVDHSSCQLHTPWKAASVLVSAPTCSPTFIEYAKSELPHRSNDFFRAGPGQQTGPIDLPAYSHGTPSLMAESGSSTTVVDGAGGQPDGWGLDHRKGVASDADQTSSGNHYYVLQQSSKRLSLPTLRYAWSDTTGNNGDGHRCLGYAVEE
ncbi:hypothetical protein BJ170DRAFT_245640 [Xylariales sp. AK1849]|nr:hypothetical protein BJ170DRAFT_245640 [Xylariales sp. AK1849]